MSKIYEMPEKGFKKKGLERINQYVFHDGEMEVPDDAEPLLTPILVRYYGCTVRDGKPAPKEEVKSDASLAAANTKK